MGTLVDSDRSIGVLEHSQRPVFASSYAIAGRFISVEADAAEVAKLFEQYFTGWHLTALSSSSQDQVDATIRVNPREPVPQSPSHYESFEVAEGGMCRTDGQTYFFESNGSVVRAANDFPPRVEVWLGSRPPARERAALARVIFHASTTAMRRCGLFELHAAGVVTPGGAGMLFVGASGSGKTTLATQLALAGWQYLSDDLVLLHRRNGNIEAQALRRLFAVADPTLATGVLDGYEEHLREAVPFDPLKRRFEPESVFPGRFVESCIPRAVFLPVLTNEPTSKTRKLTPGQTMARLIRMCPWATYDQPAAQTHLAVLAELARQADGYELSAGKDLFGDAEYVGSYLLSQAGSA